ncbi:Nucleoside triphosphate pyrophosphohydrolase [bioreactor metagenome]|uniref:Nucleoside triphosphate pyrophosphohydrolase n=1 Tax=bioreactor metagenome TaxID=1076179 RepID=A0A645D2B4_9ZZZZ|nr:nucleoside triphosphate pyrophosphohydrolase [Paludibacter sp.]
MHNIQEKLDEFRRLLEIMKELRTKCPWDKEQTFESLRTLTIEETYELADAILKDDKKEISKELGDLLLHIVFYAEMGNESRDFDIYDVTKNLCEKLIYRHPHIFGDVEANSPEKVMQNWEDLKLKEKGGNKTVLSGVPVSLPALIKAHRIQDKARSVGFDWEEREQVWDKVNEEINELKAEIASMDQNKMEAEFGDLMFSLINAARLYNINPENALERTNRKFIQRFNYLESKTITIGKDLKKMSLAEMDKLWEEAKTFEK